MMRCLVPLLLVSALAGCTYAPDAPGFWEKAAQYKCKHLRKCDGDFFDDNWDSAEDCKRAHYAEVGLPEDFEEQCPGYDPDEAHECLEHMRDLVRECDFADDRDARDAWDAACGAVCGEFGVSRSVFEDQSLPTDLR